SGEARLGDRIHKRRGKAQIGNRVQEDVVVSNAIAAAHDQLAPAGVPGKTHARSGVPVAVEGLAADVDSAERTGAEHAERRGVLGIDVGKDVVLLRDAARGFNTEAQI